MIQVKHIKKVTSFLLIFVTALLLVACSKKENVPYGSITDKEYLTVGDVTITEKDLYNNLRRDSQGFLSNLIEENMFAGYKEDALVLLGENFPEEDSDKAELVKKMFDEAVNKKIFNTTDLEVINKLPELNKTINIENYVNGLYQVNYGINRTELKATIKSLVEAIDVEEEIVGFYNVDELKDLYLIEIQKHLYAEEQLEVDVLDKDSSQYMDKKNISSIISHYKNNVKDQYDVNLFYFYFININEANAAFREVGIKTSTSGEYYRVPNIRNVDDYLTHQADTAVINALEKANLADKFNEGEFDEDGILTGITEKDFTNFYNAYAVSDSTHTKLNDFEVLNIFIELYNLVNEYDKNGTKVNGILPGNFDEDTNFQDEDLIKYNNNNQTAFDTDMTREEFDELNSSFASYFYKELSSEKPYSTLRSVGNRRYLAFKLSEDVYELDYVSEEKDEDNKEQWVTISELKKLLEDEKTHDKTLNQLKALVPEIGTEVTEEQWTEIETIMAENIAEWTVEVKDAKLTSSYTSTKVSTLVTDAKISIYDPIIRTFYNQKGEAKGSNKTGNIVATVEYKLNDKKESFDITTDELYALLEANNGLELALDLAFNEILLKEYKNGYFKEYKDEINMKTFKSEYKELIKNFSNDGFAQAGYPASIGREAFLQILFGASNPTDAIELGYLVPKLRELFFEKVELGLGSFSDTVKNQEDLFKVLADFTKKQYDEYTGVKVHHLLVFFDKDGSGTPVDPDEYLDALTEEQRKEVEEAIVELQELLLYEIGKSAKGSANSSAKVSVESFVDAFNGSAGISNSYSEATRLDLHKNERTDFQKFKKLGINIKFEDISSVITNTSNLPYQSSTLDKVFYDRAVALREYVLEFVGDEDELKKNLPYFDFGGDLNTIDDKDIILQDHLDDIKSSFGYHFILVDEISEKESAKYKPTSSELDDPKYSFKLDKNDKDEDALTIYNEDSDEITVDQIRYYILGKEHNASLPTAVEKAFNAYFTPVNTLYNSDAVKQAIFYSYLSNNNIELNDDMKTRFNVLRELNETGFNNYMNIIKDIDGSNYDNWNALYGNWYEAFGIK